MSKKQQSKRSIGDVTRQRARRVEQQAQPRADREYRPDRIQTSRVDGWEKRLTAVFIRHHAAPFDYAGSNCVSLMADAIEALTGRRPFDELIHGVENAQQYRRRIARACGKASLSHFLSLHFDEIPPTYAQRGDLCIIDVDGDEHGAVMSDDTVLAKSRTSMMRCSRSMITRAFKVR